MYELNVYQDHGLEIYEFINSEKNSWLKVVPERGGIITGFGVEGEEVLFLNNDTLYDVEKNIRGGVPILFPISGQLDQGEYEWNGQTYRMKNHGVARNERWEVVETTAEESEATITLRLKSNAETKREYPFDFELTFIYRLTKGKVTISQHYRNLSDTVMPMYAGFHPYFKTAEKTLTYDTDATEYLDYNDMKVKEVQGPIALKEKESLTLLDAKKSEISFDLPDQKRKITLTYSDVFKYVVLWTEKGKEFVCVEPWMAKNDELNHKEELVMVGASETLSAELQISVI